MSLTQFELRQLSWRKARRSMNNGDCVEVALVGGRLFVRDSKNPGGPALEYATDVWSSFLAEAKQDSID